MKRPFNFFLVQAPSARVVVALAAVGVMGLVAAGYAAVQLSNSAQMAFHGTPYPDSPPAPDFTLTDHRGERSTLSDFQGRAVLLFFGFTRCPDVCPLTLRRLTQVLEEASMDADRVSVLLVSVDPDYDTPERMKAYVESFGDRVTGLTGTKSEIDAIFGLYGIYAEETVNHAGQKALAHTNQVFGIDRQGRLQVLIHADEPAEVVEKDIQLLLRSTPES